MSRKKLFDMDGTLYCYTPDLMEKIQLSVGRAAIAMGAPLTEEEATFLARKSYEEHQHSSRIFEMDYGFHPQELMKMSFKISDVKLVVPDIKLITDFRTAALPHKDSQLVLTSSIEDWASRMLPHLNIRDCFREVVCLEHCDHAWKHDSFVPFEKSLEILNAEPQDTDLIEDSLPNLENAKKMGMRTIFVHHGKPLPELPSFVDAQIAQPAGVYTLDNV